VAIALLEEKGAAWSSLEGAYLSVREIPAIFAHYWSIEEFDGNETIHVNVSEAYADLLHKFMEDGDQAHLVDGYRRVRSAAGRIQPSVELLKPEEIAGTTTTHGSSSSGGYGYFDNGHSSSDDDSIAHD
jgi:hypothetical protein